MFSFNREVAPSATQYTEQSHGHNSRLLLRRTPTGVHKRSITIYNSEPLGPLLFSLGVHDLATNLESKINVWYLDDVTRCDVKQC